MHNVCVPEQIKKLNYDDLDLLYGDVVRLSSAVRKTKGKRFKFIGAVFDDEKDEEPAYLELIEIGKGSIRSILPENVIKDEKATKAARKRIAEAGE